MAAVPKAIAIAGSRVGAGGGDVGFDAEALGVEAIAMIFLASQEFGRTAREAPPYHIPDPATKRLVAASGLKID